MALRREQVVAVLAYDAEFTEEIDDQVGGQPGCAEEAEALWRRQQDLLAGCSCSSTSSIHPRPLKNSGLTATVWLFAGGDDPGLS